MSTRKSSGARELYVARRREDRERAEAMRRARRDANVRKGRA